MRSLWCFGSSLRTLACAGRCGYKNVRTSHGTQWRPSSSSGENVAQQWHYQEQDVHPKLMIRQEENWWERLPRGRQQHWRSCRNFWQILAVQYTWQQSPIFFICLGYEVGWQDGSLSFQRKTSKPALILQEDIWNLPNACGKMCYGLMKPRLNFLDIIPKGLAQKQHCSSPKEHHTYSEAWWWQHRALGLFFFSWNWGLSQGGGNYEQFQIPVSVGTKPLAFC